MPRFLESNRYLQRGGPGTATWKRNNYRRRKLKPYWPGLEETGEFDFDGEGASKRVTTPEGHVLVTSPTEEPDQSGISASSKKPAGAFETLESNKAVVPAWTPKKNAEGNAITKTSPPLVTPALLSETTVVSNSVSYANENSASEWNSPEASKKDRKHDSVISKLKEEHQREIQVLKEAYESNLQKRQEEHAASEREWKRQCTEKDRKIAYLWNENSHLQRASNTKSQQDQMEQMRQRLATESNFSQESQQFGDDKTYFSMTTGMGSLQERFVLHEMIHKLTNDLVKYQQETQQQPMEMKRFFQQMNLILLLVHQRDARLDLQVQKGLDLQFQVIRDRFEMKQKTSCLEQLLQQTITCCHQKPQKQNQLVQANVALPQERGMPKKLVLRRAHKPWSKAQKTTHRREVTPKQSHCM